MVFCNVSFGILALMPQGWLFMLVIILIESLLISKILTQHWKDWSVYWRVTVSNLVSGLVGMLASIKLNGGWWLVVWFPWVSNNEIHPSDQTQLTQLAILYVLAFLLTLLIEIPLTLWLLKKYITRSIVKSTLAANVLSYIIGSIALYSYSFGIVGHENDKDLDKFTELLNKDKSAVVQALKDDYEITEIESEIKNQDSVRLLFYTNRLEHFTFFITQDTLRYFGSAYGDINNLELKHFLSRDFGADSLSNLKGDIMENYNSSERTAIDLFEDEENKVRYMVVTYKADSGRSAMMVVWKRR